MPGVLAAVVLLATACGGGPDQGTTIKSTESVTGHNDINPRPAADIKPGGVLQWPIDALPANWNPDQLDGGFANGDWMITNALLPWLFTARADNSLALNKDYLTSAQLVSTNPQVVEYKINPRARWSTGRAISWEDFRAAWQACDGRNTAFQCASTTGLENIAGVERGGDDQDVKVTFARPFGEWQSLFSPLTPKELNADPDTFNKAWADTQPITAAAFKIGRIDATGKTVTLVADRSWWGSQAHLDQIVFKVVARAAVPDALASGAIDFYRIGSTVDLYKRAQTTKGVTIRQATEAQYNLVDFNGAPGTPLRDRATRVAVEQAIDTRAVARGLIGQMVPDPQPVGNHFFAQGDRNYRDNSGPVKYDPDAARKKLDELGYKQSGEFRVKDGKEFDLNFVLPAGIPLSTSIGALVQSQLKAAGINAKINAVPPADFFPNYVNRGAYDVISYSYQGQPQPLAASRSAFYYTPGNLQQNHSAVGSDELNRLLDAAGAETDDAKRIGLVQQADAEIFAEGGLLPLYQVPGTYAVRGTLVNFGAFGFAQFPIDYAAIGFAKLT
ncbi:ABC transporter family substrate-binding protein [Kutzneria buriramensis]|uniref:Peptide/nickel transport system substrate-binding protein n=1 Tax=Kutzneria buriramensis TaxID=1045776 RepID=A0A3E0H7Q4_9PSEU|nr:ABC transporter family substrate-binding protein [Kutzneria buriramensis]REH39471.1 peptide/nickel transport system substrate-binding protein [Kutzneria buriramensis]